MVDPRLLADYSAQLAEVTASSELDQRLGLYRVFVKLYDHHRWLLDEILDLENTPGRTPLNVSARFAQGVLLGNQVCLVTNLVDDCTQVFTQPQAVWTIGRDRRSMISIPDKRISRRHAAIQYVENQGFYLIDLKSTNGTYVNGEPIRHSIRLKDGDKVRLGSLSFVFFTSRVNKTLRSLSSEELTAVTSARKEGQPANDCPALSDGVCISTAIEPEGGPTDETSMFLLSRAEF